MQKVIIIAWNYEYNKVNVEDANPQESGHWINKTYCKEDQKMKMKDVFTKNSKIANVKFCPDTVASSYKNGNANN